MALIYDKEKRDKNEFYNTVNWITEKLYAMMLANVGPVKTILDPCCGAGGLEKFNQGYEYTLLDIDPKIQGTIKADFLDYDFGDTRFDAVVVNPPFAKTEEFIEKSLTLSDDVYVIAPIKSVLKKYSTQIKDYSFDWRMAYTFNIMTSIGIFHICRSYESWFGLIPKHLYHEIYSTKLPPEKTLEKITVLTDTHLKNKPCINMRITKARIIKDEVLIKDQDLHEAGDNSVFIADKANTNVKKGDKIKRQLIYFETMEDAKEFQKLYNDNSEYLRQYCYIFGNSILRMREIPLLNSEKIIKLAE